MFKTILIFLFLISSLWAKSDLSNFYELSEDIHNIVVQAAPLSSSYHLSQKEADRIVAIGDLEGQIGSYAFSVDGQKIDHEGASCEESSCFDQKEKLSLQKRIKKRKFSIYYMGTFNSSDAVSQAMGVHGSDNYAHYMEALQSRGFEKAKDIKTLDKLEDHFLSTEEAPENWDSLSLVRKAKFLQSYATERIGEKVSLGLILSEYALKDIISDTTNGWRSKLNYVKDYLTFDEKIRMASHLGEAFNSDYNSNRAKKIDGEGVGIVTIEKMIRNLSTEDKGGVCRDIALAQSQILKELGVKKDDIYIMGYDTRRGGHAVLIVRDPKNRNNIVKLNYGYITEEDDVKGVAALSQDTDLPGFGFRYRIYDSKGDPLTQLPTEMGQIYNDVVNGDYRKRDIAKTYSLQKISLNTPYGQGVVFTGRTSLGENVVGVALNESFSTKYMKGDIGLVGIKREGKKTLLSIKQDALYARLKYELNTPDIKVGDHFKLHAFGNTKLEGAISNNTVIYDDASSDKSKYHDVTVLYEGGVRASWKNDRETTKINTEVSSSGYIGFKNIVEGTSGGYQPNFDHVRWTTGVQQKVGKEMRIQGEGTIVLTKLGSSMILKAELEDKKNQLSLSGAYQRPLGDLPPFMPGASEVISLGAEKRWLNKEGRGVTMNFEYTEDLDYGRRKGTIGAGLKF